MILEETQKKWNPRFLELARLVSTWSKDPSTKTGAVIVRSNLSVASIGFNGFPMNMSDNPKLYENREIKYDRVIHCEINAILLARAPVNGMTLYTYPFGSCSRCAVHVIQSGISQVVFPVCPPDKLDRWGKNLELAKSHYIEAGVDVVEFDPQKAEIEGWIKAAVDKTLEKSFENLKNLGASCPT